MLLVLMLFISKRLRFALHIMLVIYHIHMVV